MTAALCALTSSHTLTNTVYHLENNGGHRVVVSNNAWSSIFWVSTFLDISYEFVHLAATTYNTSPWTIHRTGRGMTPNVFLC
jgi:hypothetical protein